MKKLLRHLSKKISEIGEVKEDYQRRKKQLPSLSLEPENSKGVEAVQKIEFEVSVSTIVKIMLVFWIFLALKSIFFELQTILIMSVIAFFLAMALSPFITKMEQRKIPRVIAILILYIVFFGVLGMLFIKIIPIILEQLLNVAQDLKFFLAQGDSVGFVWLDNLLLKLNLDPENIKQGLFNSVAEISNNLGGILDNLKYLGGSTLDIVSSIFQGIFNFVYVLVLLFFILLEREAIAHFALLLFPREKRDYIQSKFQFVQSKMAEWFRGQFILMLCMGSFMYVGMKIFELTLGMKYSATIGLLAGIMELFPFIGTFITGLLSLLIAINISTPLVIAVLIWIGVAQFLEGNILVPVVMEKVTGLSAVVSILAVAMGGVLGNALGGVSIAILGMMFSIPVAASVSIFVKEYVYRESKVKTK